MGLSRRFLNLIVNENRPTIFRRDWPGVTSLRTIDLGRHELFYPPGTPPPAALKVEPLTLPSPTFSFRGSRRGCLPVADRKVLCTDRYKHAFLFDAATQHVVTIPTRRVFKGMPVSVFIPSASASADDDDPDGTLFVMETWPEHEARSPEPSEQFEALVYGRSSTSSPAKSWHSQLLPPLPYLRNPKYWKFNVGITSYAVVGGGSHICVSLQPSTFTESEERLEIKNEIAGTYCLDTASHTWSKVGDWTLPFVGKVEYVPELKLWFGISASGSDSDYGYGAADLSAMDSDHQPELVGTWKEIDAAGRYGWWFDLERQQPHRLAYLGSGRFCILRFFKPAWSFSLAEGFAVLTGLEVTLQAHDGSRNGGGEAELQMVRHKSRLVSSDTCIDAVF